MKILFVMASPEYLRYYDSTIRLLAARGHDIALAVNNEQDKKPVGLEGLAALEGRVRVRGVVPEHDGLWGAVGHGLRGVMDFARYLHPRFADAPVLRARMKRKVLPRAFHALDKIRSLPPSVVCWLLRLLAGCERAIPVSAAIREFIAAENPDVLLVSPLVDAGSDQVELIKSAKALGVRSGACIASWDNLTNKGLLRVEPDLVVVWNEAQKREAVEFHGMAPETVAVTGAQLFDRWFERQPSRSREQFCARVGLPADRPFVLFTGSSSFISDSAAEVAFVRTWIEALRGSRQASVREAAVLVRPHPYNCWAWEAADLSDFAGAAIFPRRTYNPVDEINRADYFDSLYYSAAVVGINTSAMIEAAIVGRPVFSILAGEFAGTQEGTLHFHHLVSENGGCVRVASTLDEHVTQLAGSLADPAVARAETVRFVKSFIRPHGLEQPCTPRVADTIEALGRAGRREPERPPLWAYPLRPILCLIAGVAALCGMVADGRLLRGIRKRLRLRMRTHRARKKLSHAMRTALDRGRKATRGPSQRLRATVRSRARVRQAIARPGRRLVRSLRRARYAAAVLVKRAGGL